MPRRRGEQIAAYVDMGEFKYGFLLNKALHNQVKTAFGQTTYAGSAGVFFGANSPKPFRAVGKEGLLTGGSGTPSYTGNNISSFCSNNKVSTLKTAGWNVSRRNSIRGIKTSGPTRTVYITMPGGWKYAWNITAAEADLAVTLGFVQATPSDANDLIWGVNAPKPPRASTRTPAGRVSTFIKPQQSVIDAAIAAGYSVTSVNSGLVEEPTG